MTTKSKFWEKESGKELQHRKPLIPLNSTSVDLQIQMLEKEKYK